jgi:hypothetical protein
MSAPIDRRDVQPVSAHRIAGIASTSGLCLALIAGPAWATGSGTAAPATATTHCMAAGYAPARSLPQLHRAPRITFFRHLTLKAHAAKRHITWSAPATAPVIAAARTSHGARVTAGWIWHRVAHHYGEPVAAGGHRTPRTETSHGTDSVRNTTATTRHYIEFDGFTRFHGTFTQTSCAGVNEHGVGHVAHQHGSWVTFSKIEATGVVLCGAGTANNAITKAALSHCP